MFTSSYPSVQSRNWSQGFMLAQATFDRGPNLEVRGQCQKTMDNSRSKDTQIDGNNIQKTTDTK
jgi:hypothetical protein